MMHGLAQTAKNVLQRSSGSGSSEDETKGEEDPEVALKCDVKGTGIGSKALQAGSKVINSIGNGIRNLLSLRGGKSAKTTKSTTQPTLRQPPASVDDAAVAKGKKNLLSKMRAVV